MFLDDRALGGRLRVRFTLTDLTGLEQIARIEEVQWVEEVAEIIEDNVAATATIQSGSAEKHSIWDRGLHGEGQVIGVLDNGPLDIDHCFFEDPADNAPPAGTPQGSGAAQRLWDHAGRACHLCLGLRGWG
jgi:hypothetical protein